MDLGRRKLFHISSLPLVVGLLFLGFRTVHSTEIPSSWCPPQELACTCGLNEEVILDQQTVDSPADTPFLLSCDTSDIPAILDQIPWGEITHLKVLATPGSEDQVLPSSTFLKFSELRYLDLSGNALKGIDDGAFHDAANLTQLHLSHNSLQGLTYGMFSGELTVAESMEQYGLPNLAVLLLDNNEISLIDEDAFVGLSSLRRLDLTRNRIVEIGNLTFSGLSQLHILQLAGNLLGYINSSMWVQVPEVQELDLSDNGIFFVELDAFKNMSSLYVLRLDQNSIANFEAPGLKIPSVSSLNLSHNSISEMRFPFFHETTQNLTWINVDNNDLTTIEYDIWISDKIKEIYLNNNNLGDIQSPFLWELKHLQRLEMKNNRIYSIGDYMLGDLLRLQYLNLDDNDLAVFNYMAFDSEFDPLKRFQNPKPAAIRELHLNNNRLIGTLTNIIQGMRNMKVYTMSNNNIYQLSRYSFPSHDALAEVDLSLNQISRIDPETFANLKGLQYLNLRGNQIQTIPVTAFDEIPGVLLLGNNPLLCDCDIKWVRVSVSEFGDDAVCDAPEALKAQALSLLEPSAFHCPIEMAVNVSTEMTGHQGSSVTLDCPFIPTNSTRVRWFIVSYNYTTRSLTLRNLQTSYGGSRPITYSNGSLYINQIHHKSDTKYTCRATNNVDERFFSVLLRVVKSNKTFDKGDKREDGKRLKIGKGEVMKYSLGGVAGAVLLIGLIGVLLALFLPARRLRNKEIESSEKEVSAHEKCQK